MKMVISYKGVSRHLETPFALCMGMNDLDDLISTLQSARAGMIDSTYGWMRIDPSHPSDSPPNTPPRQWEE